MIYIISLPRQSSLLRCPGTRGDFAPFSGFPESSHFQTLCQLQWLPFGTGWLPEGSFIVSDLLPIQDVILPSPRSLLSDSLHHGLVSILPYWLNGLAPLPPTATAEEALLLYLSVLLPQGLPPILSQPEEVGVPSPYGMPGQAATRGSSCTQAPLPPL